MTDTPTPEQKRTHKYYEANKDKKITCDYCKTELTKYNRHKHMKTTKHKYNVMIAERN